jgi:hypothetical protein
LPTLLDLESAFEIVLKSDQANVVSENLLVAEREASDCAAAYRAGRSWSFSLVLAIFAFGRCGLISFTWFFVGINRFHVALAM